MQITPQSVNQPAISIVMPVKNTALYLDDCLSSIRAQTCSEWELICIDDGSTDDSSAILDKRAESDDRIRVIHQLCGNAGSARNLGLTYAAGDYIAFLDSDDFFEPTMLEEALKEAQEHNADIVVFGGRRFDDKTKELSDRFQFVNTKFAGARCFNRDTLPNSLFQTTYPGPCAKLFRRHFLEEQQLHFQSLSNAEDLCFTLSAMAAAERIVAFDGDFLRYRINNHSSNEATKHLDPLCFLEALFALKDFLESRGLYSQLQASFIGQFLSTTRYNLDTVLTDQAREAIIDALQTEPLKKLDLFDRDESWYPSTYAYECARYLKAAIDQQRTLKIELRGFAIDESLECIIENQLKGTPIVSVVVPVYNTGHLVTETLDSICRQTLSNIEVICIDDGSSDDSLEILTAYARNDSRIAVYHQSNQGLGATRNAGQLLARGKYLSFIDSDDLLAENAYSLCVDRAQQDDLDVVFYDALSFYDNEQLERDYPIYRTFYQRTKEYAATRSGLEMLSDMVEEGDYKPTAWLYIAKREFLASNCIFTHPGIIHEDNGFTFKVLVHAQKAAHVKMNLYKRRVREGSIMTTPRSFANAYGYYACSVDMIGDICKKCPTHAAHNSAANALLLLLYRVQHNARIAFANLPDYERGALKGLPSTSAEAMSTAMEQAFISCNAKRQIQDLKSRASSAKETADRIRKSTSYRLGLKATAPLRFLKRCLPKQK